MARPMAAIEMASIMRTMPASTMGELAGATGSAATRSASGINGRVGASATAAAGAAAAVHTGAAPITLRASNWSMTRLHSNQGSEPPAELAGPVVGQKGSRNT